LFDRHFRLLREDTVGLLRDAAKVELERLQNPDASGNGWQNRHAARTFVYHRIEIADGAFDESSGIKFVICFDQPKELQRKSAAQRPPPRSECCMLPTSRSQPHPRQVRATRKAQKRSSCTQSIALQWAVDRIIKIERRHGKLFTG
ncbi:hypothetical protein LTR74_018323, partial [Friedmanniomyces endolithicus]